MDDATRIDTVRRYLRRTFAANPTGLRALATQLYTSGTTSVTLTGQSFEGGSHSGQITFETLAYLTAVEDVLSEIDADSPPPTPDRTYARFSPAPVITTTATGCTS